MTPESFDAADSVATLLRAGGTRPVPHPDAVTRARDAAHAAWLEGVRTRRRNRTITIVLLAAAAVVVLAVVREWPRATRPAATVARLTATTGTLRRGGAALRVSDAIPAEAALVTDGASRAALRLSSGAALRLDVATEILFEGDGIVRLTRGAVFFDDEGVRTRSIEVRADLGTVRDIGTRFEVRRGEDGLRVRVRDGRVQLDAGGATYVADRGVQLHARRGLDVVREHAPASGTDWDWVALAGEPFALDGRTVPEFLAWASREGGWDVRFADEALARSTRTVVIRGSIDGLTPAQALDIVLPTCGLTHRIRDGVLVIESANAVGGRP